MTGGTRGVSGTRRRRSAGLCLVALTLLFVRSGTSLAAEPRSDETAEQAARVLIRTEIDPKVFDDLYVQASSAAVKNLEEAIRPSLRRGLTDDERKRLSLFWQRKIRELMPYSAIENRLVPLITKQVSLEDLEEINRFNSSSVGRKASEAQNLMSRETMAAGEQLGNKLGDKVWQSKVEEEMRRQFPQLFPRAIGGK